MQQVIPFQFKLSDLKNITCNKISALHLNAKITNRAPRKPRKLQIPERALNIPFKIIKLT